jgi:D-lactate dehydrogenase
MSVKVAFYDAHPYDINSSDSVNSQFGYEINYFNEHLDKNIVLLSKVSML